MYFHHSSVSCLALATAATLACPLNASAGDYVYRCGRQVAASLEMPVAAGNLIVNEGAASNDGALKTVRVRAGSFTNNGTGKVETASVANGVIANSGQIGDVRVGPGGTLTNNQSGAITTVESSGMVSNDGQMTTVTQTAGALTNNGTILGQATVSGGTLTNNRLLSAIVIGDSASFVNNQAGSVGTLTMSGDTTNNGAINMAIVAAGTFVNNETGTIQSANLDGGQLQNSGTISSLTIGEDGNFANNATGVAGTVATSGTGSNGGSVTNLNVIDGTFNNSGTVFENVSIAAEGVFSSTGHIGGRLINFGEANLAGSINGSLANATGATVNLTGNLAGGGVFLNDGTLNSVGMRLVSGFDGFENTGVMNLSDDLTIAGLVISSGTLRLGNQITGDSLSVDGALVLGSTSVTTLDIANDGSHDTIASTGDITLGGRLDIAASAGDYSLINRFTIFTSSAGDIIGRFGAVVIGGIGNLFGTVDETADGLTLTVRNRDVLDSQLAGLQLGEAGRVLSGFDYSGVAGAELFDVVSVMNEAEAPGLFEQMAGSANAAATNLGSSAARGFGNLLQKVASASGLNRSNESVLAYQKAIAAEARIFAPVLGSRLNTKPKTFAFWARGFGETGSGTTGEARAGGLGAGVEISVAPNLIAGASLGYSTAKLGEGSPGEENTNSYHGGVYVAAGATAPDTTGFGLTANASYSDHETVAKRTILIGDLTSVASANYGGSTIAGEVMVRNGFAVGSNIPLTIAPVAGLKFGFHKDDGYLETGADALNLSVSSAKRKSLIGIVGLQLASHIETEKFVFTPHISAAYQHEFLDTSSITTRMLAGSSTPFIIKEDGPSRDSVALEAGLSMRFANGLAVDISGYSVLAAGEKRYGTTATLKAGF